MTNQSKVSNRHLLKTLAIILAVVAFVSSISFDAFAGSSNEYSVTVVDGAKETVVTTTETEPIEILNTAGITVRPDDKMDLSAFVGGEGGKILITRYSTVNVDYDKVITTYKVYSATVGEALKEIGVTPGKHDKVDYATTSPIQDGMVIKVRTAFIVTVKADGKSHKTYVTEGTVKDALTAAGVKLGKEDYTAPAQKTALKKNMKIKVNRVTYKTEKKTKAVNFKTVEVKDKKLTKGTKKIKTAGKKGSKVISYKVKYVNGKEVSRAKSGEKITKKPTDQVVRVGTKKVETEDGVIVKANGVKSRGGIHVGDTISGRYTHYCACATCNGNSRGITASGKRIRNGMKNPHYIACNWLPLGSVVSVGGTTYTIVDRGGSGLSRKGRIDIFTPGGHAECYRKGTGSCKIKIIRIGW